MASSAFLVALSLAATLAAGDVLPVESMELEVREATVEDLSGEPLAATVRTATVRTAAATSEPIWVAWEVESVAHRNSLCCGRGPHCNVEGSETHIDNRDRPVQRAISVLIRFEGGTPQRIRTVSLDCPVGFSGRQVLWAGRVDADQSLDLLEEWMEAGERRLSESATVALAMHAAPRAAATLTTIARHHSSDDRRQEALFWLGQNDSEGAGDTVYQAAMTDRSADVARHAVFVLSQFDEPRGLTYLVRMLEQLERPELRKEALFWIGQSSEPDALETVSRILNQ